MRTLNKVIIEFNNLDSIELPADAFEVFSVDSIEKKYEIEYSVIKEIYTANYVLFSVKNEYNHDYGHITLFERLQKNDIYGLLLVDNNNNHNRIRVFFEPKEGNEDANEHQFTHVDDVNGEISVMISRL